MSKSDLIRGFITGSLFGLVFALVLTAYFFADFSVCRERVRTYEYTINNLRMDFNDYKQLVNKTVGDINETKELSNKGD